MNKICIELKVHYWGFGEYCKSVVIPISADLIQELMGKVELSNEPFSLMLASPGVFGGKGNALNIRNKAFELRREVAQAIAEAMIPELIKAFGCNDELDGYKIDTMSNEEKEWHQQRGRLPRT